MRIGPLETDERVVIVAEIGNNHEGDVEVARRMIRAAAEAGADAVKFQTYRAEDFVGRDAGERYRLLQRFAFPPPVFASLAEEARAAGLVFLSTPLDLASAEALEPLVPAWKVASGDLDFFPLLDRLGATGRPVILSTGAGDLGRVERAVERLRAAGAREIALLHCVSAYPLPPSQANLLAIRTLTDRFGLPVGYSDHTAGIEACLAAVALGARILEKHFTLDKKRTSFPDHVLSAEPADLAALVDGVRRVEAMRGDGTKRLMPAEVEVARGVRRSAAAARDLSAGDVLAAVDLVWPRGEGGVPADSPERIIGRRLARAVRAGERVAETDLT